MATIQYPNFYYASENELKNDWYRHTTMDNVAVLKDGSFRQRYGYGQNTVTLRAFRSN